MPLLFYITIIHLLSQTSMGLGYSSQWKAGIILRSDVRILLLKGTLVFPFPDKKTKAFRYEAWIPVCKNISKNLFKINGVNNKQMEVFHVLMNLASFLWLPRCSSYSLLPLTYQLLEPNKAPLRHTSSIFQAHLSYLFPSLSTYPSLSENSIKACCRDHSTFSR